jgi:NCAIR mutase (PurE)-related protein
MAGWFRGSGHCRADMWGYGASVQRLAPLLTLLNSCAAGVGVVIFDLVLGIAVLASRFNQSAPVT